ncbi:MAG: acyl-CoA dehydrogenase family protein [Bauldia litoralis]
MDFDHPPAVRALMDRLEAFMAAEVMPRARAWREAGLTGEYPPFVGEIQAKARDAGLWNMAVPNLPEDAPGHRLTNTEFAPLAEIMGRFMGAPKAFNCHAPDVPNMIMLADAVTPEQRRRWLDPLLEGQVQSAFAMTEPAVASSDAANIRTTIRREGDDYVIDGRKWFISGGGAAAFHLVMGVTDPAADPAARQSVVMVPADAPGVRLIRPLTFLGFMEPGAGAWEIAYEGVRVPAENLLGREGDGFRLGQVRLGPARVHHCMRAIGHSETLIELMLQRARERRAFGRAIAEFDSIQHMIARSRIELDQARLLTWKCAWSLDRDGFRAARQEVSLIKVAVAETYQRIADRALQVFGAMGGSTDAPIADAFAWARGLRIFDGPDEVHLRQIYRLEPQPAGALGASPHVLPPPD